MALYRQDVQSTLGGPAPEAENPLLALVKEALRPRPINPELVRGKERTMKGFADAGRRVAGIPGDIMDYFAERGRVAGEREDAEQYQRASRIAVEKGLKTPEQHAADMAARGMEP